MRKSLYLLMLLTMLSGCFDSDPGDVKAYIQKIKQGKPGPIEPIPQMAEYQGKDYNVEKLRSPFELSSDMQKAVVEVEEFEEEIIEEVEFYQAPRPDSARSRELLEEFALANLSMVGTLQKGKEIWVLPGIFTSKSYLAKVFSIPILH